MCDVVLHDVLAVCQVTCLLKNAVATATTQLVSIAAFTQCCEHIVLHFQCCEHTVLRSYSAVIVQCCNHIAIVIWLSVMTNIAIRISYQIRKYYLFQT